MFVGLCCVAICEKCYLYTRFPPEQEGALPRYYSQLPQEERAKLLKDRLKKYCQRVCLPLSMSLCASNGHVPVNNCISFLEPWC